MARPVPFDGSYRCLCALGQHGGRADARHVQLAIRLVLHRVSHTPRDDDVLRRHRHLVRADRRSSCPPASGRPAATGAAPTTSRDTRTSATSPARSRRPQGSRRDLRIVPRRHAHRSRPAAAVRHRAGLRRRGRPLPARQQLPGPATTSATCTSARSSTCGRRSAAEAGGDGRARARSSCRPARRTRASSTGKLDGLFDFIASKEVSQAIEAVVVSAATSSAACRRLRRAERRVPLGRRRGVPVAQPAARVRRVERHVPSTSTTTITGAPLIGIDGSLAPTTSDTQSLTRATGGINFQSRNGFFAGVGLSWNVPREARLTGRREADDDPFGDYVDWQFRIGFHPGRARVRAAAAAATAARRRRRHRRRRSHRRRTTWR